MSLLGMSLQQRLALAFLAIALLWLLLAWALQ